MRRVLLVLVALLCLKAGLGGAMAGGMAAAQFDRALAAAAGLDMPADCPMHAQQPQAGGGQDGAAMPAGCEGCLDCESCALPALAAGTGAAWQALHAALPPPPRVAFASADARHGSRPPAA
jgi:hypothetical protein